MNIWTLVMTMFDICAISGLKTITLTAVYTNAAIQDSRGNASTLHANPFRTPREMPSNVSQRTPDPPRSVSQHAKSQNPEWEK